MDQYKVTTLCLQDNSTNLLHYLVTQYISKYEAHSGTDHAQLPVPEPSIISQAAAINFDDLQLELNRLHAAVEGFYWIDWFDADKLTISKAWVKEW